MSEHIPEWGEIATGFGEYAERLCREEDGNAGYGHDYRDGSGYAAAYRWLANHDAQVAAQALRDAATDMRSDKDPGHWNLRVNGNPEHSASPDAWLEYRADRTASHLLGEGS